jgi:hypothetical protein
MQYRTLGRTGVQVSTLVLGAMNFGSLGRTTQDQVTAMVGTALEEGARPSRRAPTWPRTRSSTRRPLCLTRRSDAVSHPYWKDGRTHDANTPAPFRDRDRPATG